MRRLRRRLGVRDLGVSVIEVSMGAMIAMIGLALVATTLVTAQKQERIVDETGRASDTARIAVSQIVREMRQATNVTMSGLDARAWYDADRDAVEDAGEVVLYGLRSDGSSQKLVRDVNGTQRILATGIASGTFARSLQTNGVRVEITLSVLGRDGRAGTAVQSEVLVRGNG